MDSRSVGNNNKIQPCAGPPQKMNAFFVTRNASNAQAQVAYGGGGSIAHAQLKADLSVRLSTASHLRPPAVNHALSPPHRLN